jgi:hypothetical protein
MKNQVKALILLANPQSACKQGEKKKVNIVQSPHKTARMAGFFYKRPSY